MLCRMTFGSILMVIGSGRQPRQSWCRHQTSCWILFDMDEEPISGEFEDFGIAKAEGLRLFAHLASSGNPGH